MEVGVTGGLAGSVVELGSKERAAPGCDCGIRGVIGRKRRRAGGEAELLPARTEMLNRSTNNDGDAGSFNREMVSQGRGRHRQR